MNSDENSSQDYEGPMTVCDANAGLEAPPMLHHENSQHTDLPTNGKSLSSGHSSRHSSTPASPHHQNRRDSASLSTTGTDDDEDPREDDHHNNNNNTNRRLQANCSAIEDDIDCDDDDRGFSGLPIVHFLRCPECSFVTTQKRRFESHFPCALHPVPPRYFLYICEACRAICTDRGIMEEHKETYHKGTQVNILERQKMIKPLAIPKKDKSAPGPLPPTTPIKSCAPTVTSDSSTHSPSSPADSTPTPAPSSLPPPPVSDICPQDRLAPSHPLYFTRQPIPCPVCGTMCLSGAEELVHHLQMAHSQHPFAHPVSSAPSLMAMSAAGKQSKDVSMSGLPPPLAPWYPGSHPSISSPSSHLSSSQQQTTQLCTFCSAVFRTQRQLENHIAAVHPRPSPSSASGVTMPGLSLTTSSSMPTLHQLQAALMAHMGTSLKLGLPPLPHPALGHPPSMSMALGMMHHREEQDPHAGGSISPPDSKRLRIVEDGIALGVSSPHSALNGSLMSRSNGHSQGVCTGTPTGPSRSRRGHSYTPPPHSAPSHSHHHRGATKAGSGSTSEINSVVHNTLRKTKSDIKVIRRYLLHIKGEHRDIHAIPPEELAVYLQDFVLTARKKDGHEYEPESLKAFIHSLERHLKYYNYPSSVLKDAPFAATRNIMHQRLLELRQMSRVLGGSGSKSAQGMTAAELIQAGVIGSDNPQALLNTLWLFNRTYFNIGGTQRHKNLLWGQFQIVVGPEAEEYLQYQASVHEETRFFRGGINPANPDQLPLDCVEIFRIYANMRPMEARTPQDPFYLGPDSAWEQGGPWFRPIPAGVQLIAKIPKMVGLKSRGGVISPGTSSRPRPNTDDDGESMSGGVGGGEGSDSSPGSPALLPTEARYRPDDADVDEQEEAVDMSARGGVRVPRASLHLAMPTLQQQT